MTTIPGESLDLWQGEAKTIRFTIKDKDTGLVIDCSAATFAFQMRKTAATTSAVITKVHADFDTAQADVGIVNLPLSTSDTTQTKGSYVGQLRTEFDANDVDLSDAIAIEIRDAIWEAS